MFVKTHNGWLGNWRVWVRKEVDISHLENEIDARVYELYNLTQEEIAIVEGVNE